MLDELIRELEELAKTPGINKKVPSLNQKLQYLYDLLGRTEQVGELSVNSEEGIVKKYFCFEPFHNVGYIVEKKNLNITVVSYSKMTREEFVRKHFKVKHDFLEDEDLDFNENKRVKKREKSLYSLLVLPFTLLPMAFYAIKKYYDNKKKEKK